MLRTAITIVALWACRFACADEFSWEVSGAFLQSELDDYAKTDRTELGSTYYFGGVDDSRGPYELAAFLGPVTRMSASVAHDRQTSRVIGPPQLIPVPEVVRTVDDYSIAGRYVLPASKWYAGGSYTTSSVTNPTLLQFAEFDQKAYSVVAGKYLGPRTSLELSMNRSRQESVQVLASICIRPTACIPPLGFGQDSRTDDVGMSFVHVRRFRSLDYSLLGRAAQTSAHARIGSLVPLASGPPFLPVSTQSTSAEIVTPDSWAYSVGTELFPTQKFGVRVDYTTFDDDPARDDAYDVVATWFFRRRVSVQFAWSQTSSPPSLAARYNDTAAVHFIGRL